VVSWGESSRAARSGSLGKPACCTKTEETTLEQTKHNETSLDPIKQHSMARNNTQSKERTLDFIKQH
jgi:hypothetical protein